MFKLLFIFIFILTLGCKAKKTNSTADSLKVNARSLERSPENEKIKEEYCRYFAGVLPYAESKGLFVRLSFYIDHTVIKSENNQLIGGGFYETSLGKWNLENNIYEIVYKNNTKEYFKIKTDSIITKLDEQKKEILGFKDIHSLNLKKLLISDSLVGFYVSKASKLFNHKILSIKQIDKELATFEISIKKAINSNVGCKFGAIGLLRNNQIEIPLNKFNKDLKSYLIIDFKHKGNIVSVANIKISNLKDTTILNNLCTDGSTLLMSFTKSY